MIVAALLPNLAATFAQPLRLVSGQLPGADSTLDPLAFMTIVVSLSERRGR
jgi:hypothetical protein